jgi:hypothetical protein
MTMRVKLVIISKIAGASDRTVSRTIICIAAEKFSRLLRSGIYGMPGGAAADATLGVVPVPPGEGAAGGGTVLGVFAPAGAFAPIDAAEPPGPEIAGFSWAFAGNAADRTITAKQNHATPIRGERGCLAGIN